MNALEYARANMQLYDYIARQFVSYCKAKDKTRIKEWKTRMRTLDFRLKDWENDTATAKEPIP